MPSAKMLANYVKPSYLRPFLRDFFAGNLPGRIYEKGTTPVLIVLPTLLFAPLRFLSDKTEYRKINLIRDLLSSYVGLATFYGVRTAAGAILKKRGVINPQLRFLMAVTGGVLSRTVFQAMGSNKLASAMADKGWIKVSHDIKEPLKEPLDVEKLMKISAEHLSHKVQNPLTTVTQPPLHYDPTPQPLPLITPVNPAVNHLAGVPVTAFQRGFSRVMPFPQSTFRV